MNHGLWLRNLESTGATRLIEWAVMAEDAGWDGVFVSDSLPFADYPDPWVLLAGIAARTDRIRLGTWVVPVPRGRPPEIAQEVATLDRLSGGRAILGVGLGNEQDYEAFGRPYDPPDLGDQFDEALDVITGLWGDGSFSYDGQHFTLADAEVHPKPVQQPRVPILAGCWWPNRKPFRRGARWDGIMPYFPSLTGEGTGPHGEEAAGEPGAELRDALEYYRGITDDRGEVLVPELPGLDPVEYAELGVTWLLTTDLGDDAADAEETIRGGPPE